MYHPPFKMQSNEPKKNGETATPILICDNCKKPTTHTFSEHRVSQFHTVEHIYRCEVCNAPRRFGLTLRATTNVLAN